MSSKKAARPDLRMVVNNPDEPVAEHAAAVSPEQVEMPFAMVHGEPVTQLPKDLYIPPQALEVFLEAFEGPLDLLLYMIRRQNLDILDIPIADITKQYMEYITLMEGLQLELAGEYLVMAATLAEIKSRMLLPRATDPNAGEESDPRADLVRRLQEYERFKTAAQNIDRKLITDVTVFDVYEGEGIEPGKKSIAIAVTLQPRDKTMTDANRRGPCHRSPCRKCSWRFATWCSAPKCSPTTTCSASGCRCASACLIFSRPSSVRVSSSSCTSLRPKRAAWGSR